MPVSSRLKSSAFQKPFTWKCGTSPAAIRMMKALMTSRKSPMLTSVKGSVSTIRMGRIKLLSNAMTAAVRMAAPTVSTCTPGSR